MRSVMPLKHKEIMKKLLSKLQPKKKTPEEPAGRITTETIAEHRERVLAGGRKFKYPVQVARHRLVITASLISVGAIILLVVLGWWQLYVVQNTSDIAYRVTKVIPVPVAVVDGESVRYSEYLMRYRGAIHYLTEKERLNIATEDGQRQSDFVKQRAMADAIADAYAQKLAKEKSISVTGAELEAYLKQQRTAMDDNVSENTYNTVIRDYYGWSPEEYRDSMKAKLLRQKVAYELDSSAKAVANDIRTALRAGQTDLAIITAAQNESKAQSATYWPAAWVPRTNQDGGLAATTAKLEKGGVSDIITSTIGDGYYIARLVDSDEIRLQYEYIHIPLSTFSKQLETLRKDGKFSEFITIPEAEVAKNK